MAFIANNVLDGNHYTMKLSAGLATFSFFIKEDGLSRLHA